MAARALRLTIQPWEVRAADNFEKVFAAMGKQRPDGLYVTGGQLMNANGKRIAAFTLKSRLPSMYGRREAVDAGGLMSYGADYADSYRRVAYYVDRILKGAKPADLPVEQPTKFELVINLKTANQIGLTIPPDVSSTGDENHSVRREPQRMSGHRMGRCFAESSFLAEQSQRREGGSVTKVVTISGADQDGTLTRKTNYFEVRLLFLRQWKMYVLPRFRHKTSTARREAKGMRREKNE